MSDTNFHALAKDAGNRLKAYILAYASGATGVFFLALSSSDAGKFSLWQRRFLLTAILFFVGTVALCLIELHIVCRRFFYITEQNKLPLNQQDWGLNETYKRVRVWLLYSSYITVFVGTIASVAFLFARTS